MALPNEPVFDDAPPLRDLDRESDVTMLRILAAWIAQHDGIDPATGAVIGRGFAVVEARL